MIYIKYLMLIIFIICLSCENQEVKDTMLEKDVEINEEYKDLDIKLKLKKNKSDIIAKLTFKNIGGKDIHIPKWYILEEELTNNYFEIVNEKGVKAEYFGKMVKRPDPPPEEDIKIIKPGVSIKVEIKLNDYYKFPANSKLYHVRFHIFWEILSNIEIIEI